jgi:hypothetical protein
MLRRVALVRTDVSEELSASFIRVTRIDELGTTLAVTSNRLTLRRNVTLMKEVLCSSETSVLTRATWRNIPEDTNLYGDSISIRKHVTITVKSEAFVATLKTRRLTNALKRSTVYDFGGFTSCPSRPDSFRTGQDIPSVSENHLSR